MNGWTSCRRILCIRADNMGDVIMSGPAMRALKESFNCTITLLTSSMGAIISPCLPSVDETLVYNLPWVKANDCVQAAACMELIGRLQAQHFDAAIIFTAYSQSALPAAMVAFMAGIPLRLAYSRENPYQLLTHWVPDKEPYSKIIHQVTRDLQLVQSIGAQVSNDRLHVDVSYLSLLSAKEKLAAIGMDTYQPWIVVHTGVSEKKREYPVALWIETIKMLRARYKIPVLLTGSDKERSQADRIQGATGEGVYAVAGLFTIHEFVAIISEASLVISVNTATVHIAAATSTPVIVLYAQTNPQHTPWKVRSRVFEFFVAEHLQSRNEVIRYVSNQLYAASTPCPSPQAVVHAAARILQDELITCNHRHPVYRNER